MKLTTGQLANIQAAAHELLGIPGVDTLFALRLAHVIELTTSPLRAYKRIREKQVDDAILVQDGEKVPELDANGEPTGNYQLDPEKLADLTKRLETLAEAGVAASLPHLSVRAIDELIQEHPKNPENERGRGWVLFALRPILELDLDGSADAASGPPATGT